MSRLLILLVPALLAVTAASGQIRAPALSDAAYCDELIYLYERYIGSSQFGPRKPVPNPDVEARWAMSRCEAGDPAAGIPVLERKLVDGRMSLPKR